MNRRHDLRVLSLTLLAGIIAAPLPSLLGCGGAETPSTLGTPETPDAGTADPVSTFPTEPPPSGVARDISFPPVLRSALSNGLEMNTVQLDQLPAVYIRLVVRSGTASDPSGQPGLASIVASMLEEGTREKSSAELAEAVEFLGAAISTNASQDQVVISFRALSEHLDTALDLVAEVATQPSFRNDELAKLRRRELDRLSLMSKRPHWLASRTYYRTLYGESHPYGHVDTTESVVERVRRNHLVRWHRQHFVPSNAYLVVVGDVTPERASAAAEAAFGGWRGGEAPEPELGEVPARNAREIVIVDRPGSVQSVIRIGNVAIARQDDDWIPLLVANQVLGGSAASRLFMDLREVRSLTYGAYSSASAKLGRGTFTASASVETEKTAEAVGAFFEHLDRIVTEAPPEEELANAERYLSDSFPLQIETPERVALMVASQRLYGLADDYWDSYRTQINAITPDVALAAAQRHIQPSRVLVVVVGQAADFADDLRAFGPVTVLDEDGVVKQTLDATSPSEPTPGEEAAAQD